MPWTGKFDHEQHELSLQEVKRKKFAAKIEENAKLLFKEELRDELRDELRAEVEEELRQLRAALDVERQGREELATRLDVQRRMANYACRQLQVLRAKVTYSPCAPTCPISVPSVFCLG